MLVSACRAVESQPGRGAVVFCFLVVFTTESVNKIKEEKVEQLKKGGGNYFTARRGNEKKKLKGGKRKQLKRTLNYKRN